MRARIARLGKRILGPTRPPLRGRRITDDLEVAIEPPALNVQSRAGAAERIVADVRRGLELFPHGWEGNTSPDATTEERVASVPWYHTIELPSGIVTPGRYDHRELVPYYGIPPDLAGKRVLDVGPWDGFWTFEFERRGADVVAVDIESLSDADLNPIQRDAVRASGLDQRFGGGFELARRELGSKVERVVSNVYDVNPELLGTYDLVHFADVLLHLERPTVALRALRSVTSGQIMVVYPFDPDLGDAPVARYLGGWHDTDWWRPSLNVGAQWIVDGGFTDLRLVSVYNLGLRGGGPGEWRAVVLARPGE